MKLNDVEWCWSFQKVFQCWESNVRIYPVNVHIYVLLYESNIFFIPQKEWTNEREKASFPGSKTLVKLKIHLFPLTYHRELKYFRLITKYLWLRLNALHFRWFYHETPERCIQRLILRLAPFGKPDQGAQIAFLRLPGLPEPQTAFHSLPNINYLDKHAFALGHTVKVQKHFKSAICWWPSA